MMPADFSCLPDSLRSLVESHWRAFIDSGQSLPEVLVGDLPVVWAGSDYVAEQMTRRPELTQWLAVPGRFASRLDPLALRGELDQLLDGVDDEAELQRRLRFMRHCHLVRIIWRDLLGSSGRGGSVYADTVHDLSLLADTLIDVALTVLYRWATARDGTPADESGSPVRLTVLAMGKLGARELNLSSDIDLIFAYESEGETRGGRRELSNHEFFVRLGQQLIRVLDQLTADGFVFRVDMRLRPWGKSGVLAVGFDAMEGYYEQQGREWERYAMIKMRPVAGDIAAGERLRERLSPFVYRRYIDFGAFQSLREMKALIEREVNRKGIQADVKLGSGGIREVEFIVQAFQLIRGGQLPVLRDPRLLAVLPKLEQAGLLPADAVAELRENYIFLRDVEHRLQAVADRQTQRLPDTDIGWQRLAFAMGFPEPAEFQRRLDRVRDQVRVHFDQVVADPERNADGHVEADDDLSDLWMGRLDQAAAIERLNNLGICDPQAVLGRLAVFRESRPVTNMQAIGRERLDRLMPFLIEAIGNQGEGDVACGRLLGFLEAVLRRSAYIALLVENPLALGQLVKLSAASPWISDQLTRHPVLLDELLDVQTLYAPPGRRELDDELRQLLLRIPADDLEQQMEGLRNFKQAHLLRVAASEVTEVLPLMKVSDYLTWLAESILNEVVWLAWIPLVEKHGRPVRQDGENCDPDFVVIGYGKLGGIELGHDSDLDLVFLHDASADGMTDGDRSVANEQFFARLGQRIIHILTARTMSGQLYDADMRLRPSGASGLLVSSMVAFERYQSEQAWTWEHQALVRARFVAGCERAGQVFEDVRHRVLCRPRDEAKLRQDVLDMRERMLAQLTSPGDGMFDLKRSPGGIVDIEFMVQYGVLRWAPRFGELTRYTDNVRLLETLASLDLMPAADAGLLREAYLAFRSAAYRLALRKEPAVVPETRFSELSEGVRTIWKTWFEL
ncbi:MAG: bifunctional [glutamate--ammonia ligase]-adenylyl-L-tyrosine phosphorylase/[glutamate--ammonia-ligase] adenylyltransferase [Alcanivoracaceae bacterium]|nr:bifunctional [glutamate--ammonia ligase]-adenylyl-L-tyrosine phosphorylase/[glutamate--ammonia-ligase] adenylyltransferase [Alcanivoracaceae bacterium]